MKTVGLINPKCWRVVYMLCGIEMQRWRSTGMFLFSTRSDGVTFPGMTLLFTTSQINNKKHWLISIQMYILYTFSLLHQLLASLETPAVSWSLTRVLVPVYVRVPFPSLKDIRMCVGESSATISKHLGFGSTERNETEKTVIKMI